MAAIKKGEKGNESLTSGYKVVTDNDKLFCLRIDRSVIVLVAVFAGMAEVDLAVANDHELDIKSTMMYRHDDYVDGIRLVNEGKVHLKPLISKTFAFKDYLKAYQYIDDNRETTMKVIINVQED